MIGEQAGTRSPKKVACYHAAVRMFGFTQAEALGQPVTRVTRRYSAPPTEMMLKN